MRRQRLVRHRATQSCSFDLLRVGSERFRTADQVRLIVEKLARRCGFDEVEAAMPEDDTRLLTHIRKERARKATRKAGAAATEVAAATHSLLTPRLLV